MKPKGWELPLIHLEDAGWILLPLSSMTSCMNSDVSYLFLLNVYMGDTPPSQRCIISLGEVTLIFEIFYRSSVQNSELLKKNLISISAMTSMKPSLLLNLICILIVHYHSHWILSVTLVQLGHCLGKWKFMQIYRSLNSIRNCPIMS